MAITKTIDQYFDDLRETRVWRSIFRSGTGSSTLKRALAIQQNVFLHLFSTKVRTLSSRIPGVTLVGTICDEGCTATDSWRTHGYARQGAR